MEFTELKIDPKLLSNVLKKGYTKTTPIQGKGIPKILENVDLIGKAETGSGKTMAFLIPTLQKILETKKNNPKLANHTLGLVLAPTRELAKQILEEALTISNELGISMISVYGGTRIDTQIRKLKKGVNLVIGCPGRVLDLAKKTCLKLNSIETFILDEADQMFDMGFFEDIKKIIEKTTDTKQTILFSATMPNEVMNLANSILKSPVTVSVGEGKPKASIKHTFYETLGRNKNELLKEVLVQTNCFSTIIFAKTKARAQNLNDFLYRAGFTCTVLEGSMSPGARKRAWDEFKSNKVQILVATDIASRGLDVKSISHIINYDMPISYEVYTHRIGRTGRYDQTGCAITLIAPEDHRMAKVLRRSLDNELDIKSVKLAKEHEVVAQRASSNRNSSARGSDQKRRFRGNSKFSRGSKRF